MKEAVRETLAAMEGQGRRKEAGKKQGKGRAVYRGKQGMKKLKRQGRDLSSIEITDGNIRSFEKYARQYDIDYCLKKDSSSEKLRYFVFFKVADADAMTAAFKEYSGHKMKGEKGSPYRKSCHWQGRIQRTGELDKTKQKTREQSL